MIIWLLPTVRAKQDTGYIPKLHTKNFDNVQNVFYFDDSPVLLLQDFQSVFQSNDNGVTWDTVELFSQDNDNTIPISIRQIDLDNQLGFAFTQSKRHYYTKDQGKSWKHFEIDEEGYTSATVSVNYDKHDYMLFSFRRCPEVLSVDVLSSECNDTFYYSKDGLATKPVRLDINGLSGCTFARTNADFHVADSELMVCTKRDFDDNGFPLKSEIVASKDFFNTILVPQSDALADAYVADIKVINSFMVAVVQKDRYDNNGMVDLYVSKDGVSFRKSFFDKQLRSWAFTLLPSTKNSLHVALRGVSNPYDFQSSTDVYRSDSQGMYFKKIISNVDGFGGGLEMIRKIQGIDGAWIAMTEGDAKADDGQRKPQNSGFARSKITLNDGDTWSYLKPLNDTNCLGDKDCSVNLMWFEERAGNGEIVSGPTPGILMGVGATGNTLPRSMNDLKTFISRDGGLSWSKVCDGPSVFTFADFGNIAIITKLNLEGFPASLEEGSTGSILFSLDQGSTWKEVDIGVSLVPDYLITAKDGTARQALLVGITPQTMTYVAITIDFDDAFSEECEKNDFEEWYARRDPQTNEPICVDGHREKYNRRKQNSKCFASKLYKDIQVIEEPCKCGLEDTECDFGFRMNTGGECDPISTVMAEDFCKGKNRKRKISLTSRRMIPDDPCSGGYKVPKNDYIVDCQVMNELAEVEKISVKFTDLDEKIIYYFYLERDPANSGVPDETLLVITETMRIYVSYDGGYSFVVPNDLMGLEGRVVSVFTNPYFPNDVYIAAQSGEVYYSNDRAVTFRSFHSPYVAGSDTKYEMSFSKSNSTKFIWYALSDCDSMGNCKSSVALTEDNGQSFVHMVDNARKCHFSDSIFSTENYNVKDNLIICEQKQEGNPYYNLIGSKNNFFSAPEIILKGIIGSTSSGEFLIVAKVNDDSSLTAFVSVDGYNFAEAKFPHNIEVTKQTAYTILNVNSKQIFMHVTTSSEYDLEFGALLKSNYNGTSYVTSLRNVNRNRAAYVDFESVQAPEGISLLNIVSNADKVKEDHVEKRLKTMITFNDGASWNSLESPSADSEGKMYACKKCSLNLHSYTERLDPSRDTYSSGSALGMLFGIGNVGEYLAPMNDDTTALFFTKDAGVTWKEIRKGQYMWEFGDQGTILVIAKSAETTNTVSYSLDQGQTWKDYEFAEKKYMISDLSTVPSDTARRFMLLAEDERGSEKVISLDFSRVYNRQCKLDLDHRTQMRDFDYWSPRYPHQEDKCLFGHESQYLRRSADVDDCFIGAAPLSKGYKHMKNCSCSRNDFECDYNFETAADGTCRLIKGLSSKDNSEICNRDDKVLEYWEPTGYRKVPLSTCEGGLELDKWASHPCPGKENDYKKEHHNGIRGFALFMVITLPLLAFLVSVAFVYDKGIRRNGGFQRFGEIRLDDDDNLHLVEENATDRVVNKIVRGGIYTFSFLTSTARKISTFFKRGVLGVRGENAGTISSLFNDRIVDNDEDSLFRYADEDDDAREIDSFLEHGLENDVGGDDQNYTDTPDDLEADADESAPTPLETDAEQSSSTHLGDDA
ncbi:hypothetical protein FOA43_004195 [Brettanomyces nanus]|uniref:VPS10 domain-containing protein n=1 Tax=Eeniella nana TaxID=13502 RepID=A0A875S590_EENNA|nr:uncharacterized protein FOA43_004195 [Brettanomyces nanus]QPG76801.1 hypothetical protein FOA43_004195 [Brettanomyces nanus]